VDSQALFVSQPQLSPRQQQVNVLFKRFDLGIDLNSDT
jgi:hypothetical protein